MSPIDNEKALDPLELLSKAEQADDLRRNISTAALLWAAASIVAVIMTYMGRVTAYGEALPAIVLITWLGAEAVARVPGRIPISICSQCGRTSILPRKSLRRLWPWKHCAYCGGALRYSCPKGHLFSLFSDDPLVIDIQLKGHEAPLTMSALWCSRCGNLSKGITAEAAKDYWHILFAHSSKSPDFYTAMLEILETSQVHRPKTGDDFVGAFEQFLKAAPDEVKKFDLLERVLNFSYLRPTEGGGLSFVLSSIFTSKEFMTAFKSLFERAPYEIDSLALINAVLGERGDEDLLEETNEIHKPMMAAVRNTRLLASILEPSIREFTKIVDIPLFGGGPCPSCSAQFHDARCGRCGDYSEPLFERGWCLNCHSLSEELRCTKCGKSSPRDGWSSHRQNTDQRH
jgi:hypothetical protein